jgi:DNA-binding PadR family transcriptional regulator
MSRAIEGHISQVSVAILLALSLRPRHGYELIQQVTEDTDGSVKLTAGSLYGALKQLHTTSLIEEIPFSDNARRRQYRLTHKGWETLHHEYLYYEKLVKIARDRKVL